MNHLSAQEVADMLAGVPSHDRDHRCPCCGHEVDRAGQPCPPCREAD